MDVTTFLREDPHLGLLGAADTAALAGAFHVEKRPAGYNFFVEGAAAAGIWLVLDGEVAVTRADGPDEINRLGPGGLFGLVALLDRGPRSATCRAATDVRVASLDRAAFERLQAENARVGFALLRAASRQLAQDFRNLDRRIRWASGSTKAPT